MLLHCPMRWHFNLEMSDKFLILEKYPAKEPEKGSQGRPHAQPQPRSSYLAASTPAATLRAPGSPGCHGDSPALQLLHLGATEDQPLAAAPGAFARQQDV